MVEESEPQEESQERWWPGVSEAQREQSSKDGEGGLESRLPVGVRNQEGRTGSQRRAEEQAGGNEQEQEWDTEKGAMESGRKRAEWTE